MNRFSVQDRRDDGDYTSITFVQKYLLTDHAIASCNAASVPDGSGQEVVQADVTKLGEVFRVCSEPAVARSGPEGSATTFRLE